MESTSRGELRQRAHRTEKIEADSVQSRQATEKRKKDEVVWGKTPSGQVFRVPTTHDVMTLFHPGYPKSHFDLVNLVLLGSQIVLFALMPKAIAQGFFLFYFAFWRIAYDAGLGWILTKQSKKKWMVREIQRLGWLDENSNPKMRNWIKNQLVGKMGKDYSFDDLPLEYNTWLLFRQVVDIILLNDFVAYCMFAFSCFRVPLGLPFIVHILRWIGGFTFIAFNLWVKTEAHHVVKDYGWYWGDVFFQRGALVFDGVFELAPHPMYSVGYAGYYGLSLIVGSYPVLFASLAAHAAQFGFLVFFENPHIERMYGQRKLLASRVPLVQKPRKPASSPRERLRTLPTDEEVEELTTPGPTEGDTTTESENEPETETETELDTPKVKDSPSKFSSSSTSQTSSTSTPIPNAERKSTTQHDIMNRYFRKEPILLRNIDPFRASDFMLLLVVFYSVISFILPRLSSQTLFAVYFIHALAWRFFHTFGLGLLLKAQSQNKFLVRHFLKHYYYPENESGIGATQEAFANWKSLMNLSSCMTYTSSLILAWQTYSLPSDWTSGDGLLRHTFGGLLIGLHIWAAKESFEVLGVFGWFFGDFFIEDYPATVEYTGIYRFLNNTEIMSGAAFFGLALISGSKLVLAMAFISTLSYWWFLRYVENPHMRKLYGQALREDAGFTKVIKKVAMKNARLLESRAAKHVPDLTRVAKEVKGSFEKVYEETADVLEEFLNKSKPRITEVVEDTKILLQQSRERLIITRVANDLSSFDTTKYHISVITKTFNIPLRFHLGEPININWKAPPSHSRKDWIGIYRLGANKSNLITNTSSFGMWVPVHDDEWDGDIPLGPHKLPASEEGVEEGKVVLKGDRLPWQTGKYELRYHHDGKYNVLSLQSPVEIYVDPPSKLTFDSVRTYLLYIVTLCLDSDPSLVPLSSSLSSSTPTITSFSNTNTDDSSSDQAHRDPDDFRFWSEKQAKRISISIKQAFNVEFAPEVVVAEANISSLTKRILVSKELFAGV